MPQNILRAGAGRFLVLVLFTIAGLSACGGGSSGDTSASTPPADVDSPTAAITAAATATAKSAITFDASTSTSADGSALSYSWDFGDAQRGAGPRIAHVFAAAGNPVVTLTVVDGAGHSASSTQKITVSASPAPAGNATVHTIVKGIDAAAISDASVARVDVAAGAAVFTDTNGRADVLVDTGSPLVLKISKDGFSDQFVAVALPPGTGSDATAQAILRPREAALSLNDAHQGGSLTGLDGATIVLPADALVTGAGDRISGPVDIAMTPVDVTRPGGGGFPGTFDGIRADAATTPIVSLGTVEFVISVAGQKVQLAPGKTATIEIPIYATTMLDGNSIAAGATVPLWSLDEASGQWIQEGSGIVVTSAGSPSGLALRAVVGHFSWWNADLGFDPYGPMPKCVYDTDSGVPDGEDTFATATVCDMLAEFDRGPAAIATRTRPLAAASPASAPARIAGYSRRLTVPIDGGVRVPVPANWNIKLSGVTLNGTWQGTTVVNGPVGETAEVLVKMRPVQGITGDVQAIVVPFDATRTIQPSQVARYSFTATALQFAQVRLDPGPASSLSAHVRLLQGTTVLATQDVSGSVSAAIVLALPADGSYGVEVESTGNGAALFRLRVDLLGGVHNETIAYPFDLQRDLPAFTTLRSAFDAPAAGAISLSLQRNGSGALSLRLLAPDGSLVASRVMLATQSSLEEVIPLPSAGRYTFEFAQQDAQATAFRITGDPTAWIPVAPGIDTDSGFAMIDLLADRNGKPVVGLLRYGISNRTSTTTMSLRRWTGTAWETVGTDFLIPLPCTQSAKSSEFAFDSSNAPLIVYGTQTSDGTSSTVVKRFSSGAWQEVGANGGTLPQASSYAGACLQQPRIALDIADRPVVAYRSDNAVFVQRFANGAWNDLAPGASFGLVSGAFDLGVDPAGTPYFVVANGAAMVLRFDAATANWAGVGVNGGLLPQTNTAGLSGMRIRFDAGGQPVVPGIAAIGTPASAFFGAIAYRFDGTAWSSSLGFSLPNSYINNTLEIASALEPGGVLMSWDNQSSDIGNAIVVQRNTGPSSWSAVGGGIGQVVQYWGHGATQNANPLDSRLLVTGGETYLTLIAHTPADTFQLVLLKKVGP